MDYQGNSKKQRESAEKKKTEEKIVEKVISGNVTEKKKPLAERFKDTFLGGDAQSVARYIGAEVLLPALRNLIVDATTKGIERMIYGERPMNRQPDYRPRITYNTPVNRRYSYSPDPRTRANLPDQPSYPTPRNQNSLILSSRDDADQVLEQMQNIIDKYDVASVADLRQLVGLDVQFTDNKWGWLSLRGATVSQIREGFLLELPPEEPL